MSGSETRIRNYHVGARVTASEKQEMFDLMKRMGFQSEGDLIRYVFFGTKPFKPLQFARKFTSLSVFVVRIVSGTEGFLSREASK